VATAIHCSGARDAGGTYPSQSPNLFDTTAEFRDVIGRLISQLAAQLVRLRRSGWDDA
jgi:hypothetical protein